LTTCRTVMANWPVAATSLASNEIATCVELMNDIVRCEPAKVNGIGVQKAAAVDQHVDRAEAAGTETGLRLVMTGALASTTVSVWAVDVGAPLPGFVTVIDSWPGFVISEARMVVVSVVELTKVVVCDVALTLICGPLRKLEPVAVRVNELPLAVAEFGEIDVSCG